MLTTIFSGLDESTVVRRPFTVKSTSRFEDDKKSTLIDASMLSDRALAVNVHVAAGIFVSVPLHDCAQMIEHETADTEQSMAEPLPLPTSYSEPELRADD